MTITAICEACQQQYQLGDAWAGKTAKCKKCGHTMQIPSAARPQGAPGERSSAASASAATAARSAAARGRQCPICDSPMAAADETCGICGYSASASKHLAATPVAPTSKAASRPAKGPAEPTAGDGGAASQLTVRLLVFGGIALAVLAIVTAVSMGVSQFLAERERLLSRERLNVMMGELREARDASYVQDVEWDFGAVDLKAVVKEYGVKFAAELPQVPEYIQEIESKNDALSDDKRRWVITLINALPPGTDLTPLQAVPPQSFAHEAATKKLAEARAGP